METNNVKLENRRVLPRFLITLLGAAILGGVAGGLLSSGQAKLLAGGVQAAVNQVMTAITPWGILISGVILLGTAFGFYRSARKIYRRWDGEDEAAAGAAEEKLSYVLLLSSVEMVIGFFFLSASNLYAGGDPMGILLVVAEFIAAAVAIVVLQQWTVDLTKTMNPEKRGSVYDLKFQRKWLESCDEAQRGRVFEASYHAFRAVNRTCVALWLALILLGFLFDFGLMPSFMVLVIWGVSQVSYTLAAIRMGKHKRG